MENKITKVQKRDGRIVDFDFERITNAIFKAITATNQGDEIKAKKIADDALRLFRRRFKNNGIPGLVNLLEHAHNLVRCSRIKVPGRFVGKYN